MRIPWMDFTQLFSLHGRLPLRNLNITVSRRKDKGILLVAVVEYVEGFLFPSEMKMINNDLFMSVETEVIYTKAALA